MLLASLVKMPVLICSTLFIVLCFCEWISNYRQSKHGVWKCPCASLLYRIFITKWGVSAFSDVCVCVCVCVCARTCFLVCHLCVILCKYVAVTILNWTQSFTSHWCSCLTKRKHEWKLQITEWVGTYIYYTHKKVFEFMWSSEIHAQILCKMKWPPKFYILVECSHHPPPPHSLINELQSYSL